MNKIILILTAILLFYIHNLYSEGQFESGFVQRHYEFSHFDSLAVDGYFRIRVIKTDKWDIHISCNREDLNNIKFRKNSDVFEISRKEPGQAGVPSPVIIISMPELLSVSLKGLVQMEAGGFSSSDKLDVAMEGGAYLNLNGFESSNTIFNITGSCKLHAFLSSDTIHFISKGNPIVRMGGRARDLIVQSEGPLRFDGSLLLVDNVDLQLTGVSEVRITPDVQMNISSTDEALIYYSDKYMDNLPVVSGPAILRKY